MGKRVFNHLHKEYEWFYDCRQHPGVVDLNLPLLWLCRDCSLDLEVIKNGQVVFVPGTESPAPENSPCSICMR